MIKICDCAGEVESRIDHLTLKGQKVALLQSQYSHVMSWYAQAKLPLPYAKRAKGSSYAVWLALLIDLQSKACYPAVFIFRAGKLPSASSGILQDLEKTAEDFCCEIMECAEIDEFTTEIVNQADTNVHRSRKHRQEAADLAAAARAENERFGGIVPDGSPDGEGGGGEGDQGDREGGEGEGDGGAAGAGRPRKKARKGSGVSHQDQAGIDGQAEAGKGNQAEGASSDSESEMSFGEISDYGLMDGDQEVDEGVDFDGLWEDEDMEMEMEMEMEMDMGF